MEPAKWPPHAQSGVIDRAILALHRAQSSPSVAPSFPTQRVNYVVNNEEKERRHGSSQAPDKTQYFGSDALVLKIE